MSRLTFRSATEDVAWQKQLRDHYADEGAPDGVDLTLDKAIVRPVSRHLAKQIILKYEWLGTMSPTSHHYGIFFGNHCAGVCCVGFSAGANLNAAQEFRLQRNQLGYLSRGANVHWSPLGANSKLVAWTCKLLARETAAKLVIAYSDTDAGEIGTIYQACNWICIGKGSSTKQWVAPNGRIFDQKYPSDRARADHYRHPRAYYVDRLRKSGWTEQMSNAKWRYVCVLDRKDQRLIDLIERKRVSYPKRAALV